MEGTQPPAEQPREPTAQQAMEMAAAAMKKAEEASSAAEARPAVEQAVKDEAEAKGLEITEENAELIATVTIQQLEARGAFGEPQGQTAQTPEEAIAQAAQGNPPPPPAGGGAPPPPAAAQPPAPASEAPAPAPTPEEAPKRKSLAERFQKK